MCGIFAVQEISTQPKKNATQLAFEGLQRLEYRGYDSWGIGVVQTQDQDEALQDVQLQLEKQVGAIGDRVAGDLPLAESSVALGHTRWATHGGVVQKNAHPHVSPDGSFMIAHNGVIENYEHIKTELLQSGIKADFESDTRVFVALVAHVRDAEGLSLSDAFVAAFERVEGRNAFVMLDAAGFLRAIRIGSPLLAGRSKDAVFFSSDVYSLGVVTDEIAVIPENTVVELASDARSGDMGLTWERAAVEFAAEERSAQAHSMLAEILQSPAAIRAAIAHTLSAQSDSLSRAQALMRSAHYIYTIGSGTAGVAAAQVAYFLRTVAGVPVHALVGAEAQDHYNFFGPETVILTTSQSGETADVLEVLEYATSKGARVISHVNMPASSIERLSQVSFAAGVGPELAVISTKVFTAQVSWGYLLSSSLAGEKELAAARSRLKHTAQVIEDNHHSDAYLEAVQQFAQDIDQYNELFLLATGEYLNMAREGMVKLIEGSYLHAHAIPAGDLKHYAITLMEQGVPVVCVGPDDDSQPLLINATHEVGARGARVLGVGVSDNSLFDSVLSVGASQGALHSLQTVVTLQLVSYYLSQLRDINPDRPRNIAKSVTVK